MHLKHFLGAKISQRRGRHCLLPSGGASGGHALHRGSLTPPSEISFLASALLASTKEVESASPSSHLPIIKSSLGEKKCHHSALSKHFLGAKISQRSGRHHLLPSDGTSGGMPPPLTEGAWPLRGDFFFLFRRGARVGMLKICTPRRGIVAPTE